MSDFFINTTYNKETKNQLWMTIIQDSHDTCCGCQKPFAHLLDSIFPEGHRDRDKTIEYIIERDKRCLSGGIEEENLGMAGGDTKDIKEEEPTDNQEREDIDLLLAAAADAAEENTR